MSAIENGAGTTQEMVKATRLKLGSVEGALQQLRASKKAHKVNGRYVPVVQDTATLITCKPWNDALFLGGSEL